MLAFVAWLAAADLDPNVRVGPPRPAAAPAAAAEAAPPEVDELVVKPPRDSVEPEWSKRLNFDVRGRYSEPADPYLRQRPLDGCKLMAGGATSLIGEEGVAGGLVCAKRF